MAFVKGYIPWNKGMQMSEEYRAKLCLIHKSMPHPTSLPGVRKKISLALKGRKLSEKHKLLIREKRKLQVMKPVSKETRKKIGDSHRGKKISDETRKKLSLAHLGQKSWIKGKHWSEEVKKKMSIARRGKYKGALSHRWQGGKTSANALIRNSAEYADWRKAVFVRDNFLCVLCKKKGGRLHADHIKAFSLFPDLRLDIKNGRTLCVDCHRKTDNFAGRALSKKTYVVH